VGAREVEESPLLPDIKYAALFFVAASNRQRQYLASSSHRCSSQGHRASKYHKKNKRDHSLEKTKGF